MTGTKNDKELNRRFHKPRPIKPYTRNRREGSLNDFDRVETVHSLRNEVTERGLSTPIKNWEMLLKVYDHLRDPYYWIYLLLLHLWSHRGLWTWNSFWYNETPFSDCYMNKTIFPFYWNTDTLTPVRTNTPHTHTIHKGPTTSL